MSIKLNDDSIIAQFVHDCLKGCILGGVYGHDNVLKTIFLCQHKDVMSANWGEGAIMEPNDR